MGSYEIFLADIKPKGFTVIELGEFTTETAVQEVRDVLENPESFVPIANHNYELGKQHFSLESLRLRLNSLIDDLMRHN